MKKRNFGWIILSIAAVVLLFFGVFQVVNQVTAFAFGKPFKIQDEIIITDSYEKIDVSAKNAIVQFSLSPTEETTIEYSGRKRSQINLNAKVKGATLSVELKEKRYGFFNFGRKEMRLTVYVPEKQLDEIKAETDNGIIRAEDLQADQITLKSDNGLIRLENSEAEQVNLKTNNGQITLNDVMGDIIAKTDNGRISYKGDDIENQISLSTVNGLISVKLGEKPSNAVIDAENQNGSINILGSKDRTSTFGEGKHLMELKTVNGRITVKK